MGAAFWFFLYVNTIVYCLWRWHERAGDFLMHLTRACECKRSWWKCTKVWKTK